MLIVSMIRKVASFLLSNFNNPFFLSRINPSHLNKISSHHYSFLTPLHLEVVGLITQLHRVFFHTLKSHQSPTRQPHWACRPPSYLRHYNCSTTLSCSNKSISSTQVSSGSHIPLSCLLDYSYFFTAHKSFLTRLSFEQAYFLCHGHESCRTDRCHGFWFKH